MTTFLPDFVSALTKELKYFASSNNMTVILDTELGGDYSASIPLCVICIEDDEESARLSGNGITRMDYNIQFYIYSLEPNAYSSEDGGSSALLLKIVDDLRNYLLIEKWQVQEMIDLTTNYGFRMQFQGAGKAPTLETEKGLCIGRALKFASIAFDQQTNASNDYLNSNQTTTGSVVFD